jgi:hypothetical protein
MFRKVEYKIVYPGLDFLEFAKVFQKNPEIFFKNGQKCVLVRLGTS